MGKKRRLLWIAGAIGAAVALFATVAFFLDDNSTDARMELAVAQIVEEYGFEKVSRPIGWDYIEWRYERRAMGEQEESEIVAILRTVSDYKYELKADDSERATSSGGVPFSWVEHIIKVSDDKGDARVHEIRFIPDDKGLGLPDGDHKAILVVHVYYAPSLWERIKGMWPW